ncbi:hypothetical protein GCM10027447_27650 [Glycomyces halotolerans]
MHSFDRAALAIGVASIASVVFAIEGLNEFRFMTIGGASAAIAIGLGAAAVAAALLAVRALAVLTGAAFAAAAALQLIATATGGDWLGADLSAMSFWLGLAIGLAVAGAAPRDGTRPAPDTEGE